MSAGLEGMDVTERVLIATTLIALLSALACWLSIAQGRPLIALSAVAADLALVVVVQSDGDDCAVALKPHRVIISCCDPDDACPVAHIALPMGVVSRGDNRTVSPQPAGQS